MICIYSYENQTLLNTPVWMEFDIEKRDTSGRILVYIWLEKPISQSDSEIRNKMLNARLLLHGRAKLDDASVNAKYLDHFIKYQLEARKSKRGLWNND